MEIKIHQTMIHVATQFDINESKKKYYNHYALGQYIDRIATIEENAKENTKVDYKSAILLEIMENFHDPLCKKLLTAVMKLTKP